MSKNVRNGIIGFAVVFVTSFLFAAIGFEGIERTACSMGLGMLTYYALQSRSGTEKEVFATDASRAAAVQAIPAINSALLFVRRTGIRGKIIGINVSLDGTRFAQLRSPRFTTMPIASGTHTLLATSSAASPMNQNAPGAVTFEALPGQRFLFDLSLNLGMTKGTHQLTQVSDEAAYLASLHSMPMVKAAPAGMTGSTSGEIAATS